MTMNPYEGTNEKGRGCDYPVQGVDLSKWQQEYDWQAAKEDGNIAFGFARATVGVSTDPTFERNWYEMAKLGIPRGAYHFAKPTSKGTVQDAIEEADHFCTIVEAAEKKVHGGQALHHTQAMPPTLDFEESTKASQSKEDNRKWIDAWVKRVQDRLDRGVIMYTGDRVWESEVGGEPICPLWVPQYTNKEITPGMEPWKRWVFWQWSGGGDSDMFRALTGRPFPGTVGGGSVDVNAYFGTLDQLHGLTEPCHDLFYTPGIGMSPRGEKGKKLVAVAADRLLHTHTERTHEDLMLARASELLEEAQAIIKRVRRKP